MKKTYNNPDTKAILIEPTFLLSNSTYGTTGDDEFGGTGYDNDEEEG